jgi:hypothetical protein
MFGFPFFTSLVVVLLGVVALSFIINKGLANRNQVANETPASATGKNSKHSI